MNSDKGIVLSLYDLSGAMARPWAEDGYECFIVDIQHPKGCTRHPDFANVWRWGADLLTWIPPLEKYRIVFSFSPCDDTAVSGSRWFVQKGLYALGDSIRMFARGMDIGKWSTAPYCCEHPKSTIVTHLGQEPDRIFHPWHFDWASGADDNYTKETYVWIGNGFRWPRRGRPATPADTKRIHYCPPSPERRNIRSKTPDGFARAVFLANEKGIGIAPPDEQRQMPLFGRLTEVDFPETG